MTTNDRINILTELAKCGDFSITMPNGEKRYPTAPVHFDGNHFRFYRGYQPPDYYLVNSLGQPNTNAASVDAIDCRILQLASEWKIDHPLVSQQEDQPRVSRLDFDTRRK